MTAFRIVRRPAMALAAAVAGLSFTVLGVVQATPQAPASAGQAAAAPGRGNTPIRGTNPPELFAKDATGDAKAVLELAQKVEDATVAGDVAFTTRALSSDFSMVHGDQWTRGLAPLSTDDKAGYIKRVADRQYTVHDIADTKLEVHGDVIITYGRYVSLFNAPNRSPKAPVPRLASIWFERVYAKRDGQWQYLSHRTVHGPTPSPAGIDPTAITPQNISSYVLAQPPADIAAKSYPPASPAAAELLAADARINTAIVAGDAAYWDRHVADTFRMTHGDIWTRGGPPALVDTKQSFGQRVSTKQYLALHADSVQAEMHGDVAITFGRYVATLQGSAARTPDRQWFSVWFQRVWQKRGDRWVFLSYRTVHGATYGPTRESVSMR